MKMRNYFILSALIMVGLSACKGGQGEVPSRDWDNTTYLFTSQDEPTCATFFKPYSGYVGDPMPFFDPVSKQFVVPYLQDYRPNPAGTYHPIWGVRTADACHYEAIGEMIPCGGLLEQDAALGTGSIVYDEAQKLYYFFYTGHANVVPDGGNREAIHYATSTDMKTWTKNVLFVLRGNKYGYSADDFRDPFVFADEDGLYHMLVSTTNGKNCLAEFTSTNLQQWEHKGVFMTCMWDRFYECPDLFKMGDWWYLVYSEKHSAIRKVQYFKATTLDGLKACTKDDAGLWPDNHDGFLDCRGFYAGKTATDGTNRYIWGWCPTREGQDNANTGSDKKEPEWAGTLVAHRLIQHEDGTLSLGDVPARAAAYSEAVETKVMRQEENNTLYNRLDRHNHISFTAVADSKDAQFGISLCHGTELNSLKDSASYYAIQLLQDGITYKIEFAKQGEDQKTVGWIDSYSMPIPADLTYHIDLYTDNSVVVLYVNDEMCWTNRIYGQQKNCWGLETYTGKFTFSDIKVTKY